jgi:hypothetical protein
MDKPAERRSKDRAAPLTTAPLTLLIAARVGRIACGRELAPGGELDLWLAAEAEVKRELVDPNS